MRAFIKSIFLGVTAILLVMQAVAAPKVGFMYYDYQHFDKYYSPITSTNIERDIDGIIGRYTNVITIGGITRFVGGETSNGHRIPWEVFLTDCSGQPCTEAEMRGRMGNGTVCHNPPGAVNTANKWLCELDDTKDKVDALRPGKQLVIYGHLVHDHGAATPRPLRNLSGGYPVEFNGPDGVVFKDPDVIEAHARLVRFLVQHFEPDYFIPWREVDYMAKTYEGAADLTDAYIAMAQAAYDVDNEIYFYPTWQVESFYSNCTERDGSKMGCSFKKKQGASCNLRGDSAEDADTAAAMITRFWSLHRNELIGVKTLIGLSTYPQLKVQDMVDGLATNSNFNTLLLAARNELDDPNEKVAFAITPIAINETGRSEWTGTSISNACIHDTGRRWTYDLEQALLMNYLVNYEFDPGNPAIHPLHMVVNWLAADIEIPTTFVVPDFKLPSGDFHAELNTQFRDWLSTRSGLFRGAMASYAPKLGFSAFVNTIDDDLDNDGRKNITFSANMKTITSFDNCPLHENANQLDSDGDTIGDACDNCINKHNPNQWDWDQDGIGNACDMDITNVDTLNDDSVTLDNCINTPVPSQLTCINPAGAPIVTSMVGDLDENGVIDSDDRDQFDSLFVDLFQDPSRLESGLPCQGSRICDSVPPPGC